MDLQEHFEDMYISEKAVLETIGCTSFNEVVSEYLFRLYEETNLNGLFAESERIFQCSKLWICDHYQKSNVADVQYVSHCRSRFCLMCEKLKQASYFNKYLPFFVEEAKAHALYHVVFTVPNVPGLQLRGMIDCMTKAFRRLLEFLSGRHSIGGIDFKQYGFHGGIRSLEVSYGEYGEDDFHPHYHCIIALKKELLLEKHIDNKFSYSYGKFVRSFSEFEVLLQNLWKLLIDSELKGCINTSIFRRRLGKPISKRRALTFDEPHKKKSKTSWKDRITLEKINALPLGYSVIADLIEDAGEQGNYFEVFKYVVKVTSEQQSLFTYEQFVSLYYGLSGVRQLQGFGKWHNLKFDDGFDDSVNEFYDVFIAFLRQREYPVSVRFPLEEVARKIKDEHVQFITKKSIKRFLRSSDKSLAEHKNDLGNPTPYSSSVHKLHFPDLMSAYYRYERVRRTSPLFADIREKELKAKEESTPLVLTSEQLSFLDSIF